MRPLWTGAVFAFALGLGFAACSSDEGVGPQPHGDAGDGALADAPESGDHDVLDEDAPSAPDGPVDGTAGDGGADGAVPGSVPPGAHLPISYDIGSVTGEKWFVSPVGKDSNPGTEQAPFATLKAAIGKVPAGKSATLIVRGGEYAEGNVTIPSGRAIRIVAYPGEIPVFRGSQKLAGGWTQEGSLAWHVYTPQPVTDGSGISFTTGQNLTGDHVGKYPDQAWIGGVELQQVTTKAAVSSGKFWVDATASRLYLTAADAAKPELEASAKDVFLTFSGASGSSLEGLRILRFSNSANDYGVVRVVGGANGTVLRNVEIIDAAFITLSYAGGASGILEGALLDHVTIDGPNWMGVSALYVDDLVLDGVKLSGANPFGEFTPSPQSGGAKISRCRKVKILRSEISGNRSHGIWFDQSNVDADVAGNHFFDNEASALFFEISDDLLLINNRFEAPAGGQALKLAGSSGLKLVNNTIVGGKDPVGIYTDSRSKPGCADPAQPLCPGSYSSDRDTLRPLPPTLDWMPRLDLMLDNIVVHPTGSGFCGGVAALCITSTNAGAVQPVEAILHKADPSRGIPETVINGNVYANGTGALIRASLGAFSDLTAWTAATAAPPVSLSGIDAKSKSGGQYVNPDGTPTLQLNHSDAIATPTDANINQYVPAGTRHFGALP